MSTFGNVVCDNYRHDVFIRSMKTSPSQRQLRPLRYTALADSKEKKEAVGERFLNLVKQAIKCGEQGTTPKLRKKLFA